MKVIELLKSEKPTLSFEVFPPKTQDKFESIISAAYEIGRLKPDFMSVTYGAGGGRSRYTVEMVDQLQNVLKIPVLSHLTCASSTREQVKKILEKLKEKGIENILALRGDIPEDGGVMQYKHAAELIEEIHQSGDFCIGAACYPEGHPESADKNEDLKYLKEKVDSGVDFLTTQMFFQNELFYRFLYRIREIGITVPVCAGIMPVTSSRQLKRIGGMSGAFMPQNFIAMVDRFGGSAEAMKQAGIQYAASQIIDLLANGIKHIHVYTMNRPDIAAAILENLSEIWEYEISRSAQ
ncbi:MAG: methylenetetrahydrofolate reductase [NAD(P)H] [Firmicutes bacterium]|nr:methylenetetrahydrofolate reductase [NAD(P)H] [Bacillota bacterium]